MYMDLRTEITYLTSVLRYPCSRKWISYVICLVKSYRQWEARELQSYPRDTTRIRY